MTAAPERRGQHERPLYTHAQLRPLIAPRRVAVIGASERPGFASSVVRSLQRRGLGEGLSVVNPTRPMVLGVPAVPTPADLPDGIDCAVIGVNNRLAVDLLRECGERGVKSALVHASGFAETGTDEGRLLQAQVGAIARDHDMRVCGPNVLGMFNYADDIILGGGASHRLAPGPIGVASQSGGLGVYLTQARAEGMRLFSHCLCAGNSADVDVFDFANYMLHDEATQAVVICAEGVRSVARMLELGEASRRQGKPILVFKTGRTERGLQAALSHSGSIAGSYEVAEAAFRRAGLVEVARYEDLVETALYFARAKPPTTRGVGVVTGMGGCAVMVCDAAADAGVALPMPTTETLDALSQSVPEYGVLGNPADLTANPGGEEKFESAFRVFAHDPTYDTVIFPLAPMGAGSEDRAAAVSRVAATALSTVCVYWVSRWLENPDVERLLSDPNVCTFRSVNAMFSAISKWYWWNDTASDTADDTVAARDQDGDRAIPSVHDAVDAALASRRPHAEELVALSETESRTVCEAAGVSLVPAALAAGPDEAVAAADQFGYPVVVKAVSPDLQHKTEAGAVMLDVSDPASLRAAHDEVRRRLRLHDPGAAVDGVLVAAMIPDGVEVIVGARRDPVFGPIVVCGLGGTVVEALGSPSLDLAPVSPERARAMVDAMPGATLLGAFRGRGPRDAEALAAIVAGVSRLICADERIAEIDLNPVLVLGDGDGALAADALVVLREVPSRATAQHDGAVAP